MATSNRGVTTPTGAGSSTAGFPRLSIRALLLNGPFSRKSKTRRARTPTAVHSKGSSDSEGGSLEGGVDSCGRRRCGGLQGRLSSLAVRQGKGGNKLSTHGQGSLLSNGESTPPTPSFNTSTGSSSHIKTMLLNSDIHSAQTPPSPSTSTTPQPHNTTSSSSTPPPFQQSQNSTYSADQLSRVSNFTPLPRGGGSKNSLSTTGDVSTTAANGDINTCPAAASSSWGNSSNNLGDGGGGGENVNGSSSSSGCSSSADCMAGTSAGPLRECVLCLQDVPADRFPRLFSCSHSACLMCLKQYLAMEISESRVSITCPKCNELMHPTDIHQILNNSVLSYKFEDFMLRRVLSMDPDTRWCPAPDCGYAVIASGCAGCPKLQCERPGCHSYFCYHCKAEWHPNQTCDMARVQRAPHFPYPISSSHADDDVKACPRCQVLIVKMDDGSCNHMTCSVCGAEFCWLCMKEVSDLHYLSPSGCTFWGKKPWSRKKKVLWQLGTLVGAPLGIALLAGLAVPAIIIGIPMWAARKVHSRYSSAGRHKRNVMVVCSVVWSSLVSPLIAGVAVSIGVPILLAYVYGVVPISLCRSGGCGVITSATGVRFAFDDELHDGGNPASSAFSAAMSGAAAMRNLTKFNDNSASSGGGGSTDSGAGSERGRGDGGRGGCSEAGLEGASHTPAAGVGSLGSFSFISPRSHKLEVHVEMGTEGSSNSSHVGTGEGGRRFTSSCNGHRSGGGGATTGETVSLAVSERSTTTLDTETASTRALAGSIAAGAAPAGDEFALKPWQEQQDEVSSIVGVTNVAQAGDSASTVMLDNGDSVSTAGGATGGGDSVSTTGGVAGGDSLSTTSNGGGSSTGILRYPCGGGGGGAAPSILSSISATTTTNLFMPPQSSCSSVVSSPPPPPTSSSAGYYSPSFNYHSVNGGSGCHFHNHQRRAAGINGGRNFSNRTQFDDDDDEDDDTSNNNMNNDAGSHKSCGTEEGGYISGGDCSLGGGIVGPGCGGGAVGSGGRQFGSDPRLDSVSAIITARKMSAHAKGVTFSMSSASSSQSRDHISLNLDENMAGDNMDAEVYSSASGVSGMSASVSESASAAAVGDEDSYSQIVVNGINNVNNVNGIRHHFSRSSSSSGSSKSEEVLLSQQQCSIDDKNSVLDSNSEARGIDVSVRRWFNINGKSQTFNNSNNGGKALMGRKANIVPHLDYREACGDCHYDSYNEVKPGNIKSSKYYPGCGREASNSAMYSLKSTSCDPMPEDLQRQWVYFSEGSKLDQAGEGHQSERACAGNSTSDGVKAWQTPLERHMSVPEGCSVATEGSAYSSSSPTTSNNTATTRSESLSALECSLRR